MNVRAIQHVSFLIVKIYEVDFMMKQMMNIELSWIFWMVEYFIFF